MPLGPNEFYYWIGTSGPFIGNTDFEYTDPDNPHAIGNGLGVFGSSLFTKGPLVVESAPTNDNDVVRKVDLTAGLADVTIPAGFKLVFEGAGANPDAEIIWDGTRLVILIGGTIVASWRL